MGYPVQSRPTKRSGFSSTPVPRFTSALQRLSHLDGDALNVALLVPEFQRVLPGVLVKSLSEHCGAPGQLAEYKHQFERAFRRPGDDPAVFAIELETLARRAFVDIDSSLQLQMVRDRFIDGQAECAFRRHLDSLGLDTRVWESHIEVGSSRQVRLDRHSPRAVCQVTEDSQSPAVFDWVRDDGRNHATVIAEADGAASEGGPYSIGSGAAHTALAGGHTATSASDTGAVSVDGYGNCVTELALLGGTENSWTADDLYGTCYAQLDDFNWVILAGDMVGGLPEPDLEVDSSDIKPDVYNDVLDEFPVEMEVTTVESLCFFVVIQMRPQGAVTQSCPCVCAKDMIS